MTAWNSFRRAPTLGSALLGLTLLASGCGVPQEEELEPHASMSLGTVQSGLNAEYVAVYPHDGYTGTPMNLPAGDYDYYFLTMPWFGVGNDTISSVKVPPGWKATLYSDAGFRGAQKVLTQDTDLWATGSFNDMTSSVRVEAPLPGHNVVQYYFPSAVRFATGEDCIAPAEFGKDTGVALYHVGSHPKNRSRALVTFGLVFKQDCGLSGHWNAPGVDYHKGDIEYFSYTLNYDTSCSMGWRLHSIKTHAHSGDYKLREINERILDTCSPPSEIVSSLGKHALYTSWIDCSKRTPAEYCEGSRSAGFKLYNIGNSEAEAPKLYQLFGSTDTRDTVWPSAGDGRFCGGYSVSQRSGGRDCVDAPGERLAYLGNQGPRTSDKAWFLPDPGPDTSNGCPYGLDKDAGLCYKFCDPGYYGAATMCIPECPSNFRNDGLYCAKPFPWTATCPPHTTDIGVSCQKHTYDRGVGSLP